MVIHGVTIRKNLIINPYLISLGSAHNPIHEEINANTIVTIPKITFPLLLINFLPPKIKRNLEVLLSSILVSILPLFICKCNTDSDPGWSNYNSAAMPFIKSTLGALRCIRSFCGTHKNFL